MTGEHPRRRRLPGSGRDRVSIGTAGPGLSMGGARGGAPRSRKESSRIRGSPGGRQGWPGRPVAPQSAGVNAPSVLVRSRRWTRDLCVGMPCRKKPRPWPRLLEVPGSSLERGQADPWAPTAVRTGQLPGCRAGHFLFSVCTDSHRGGSSLCLSHLFPKMKGTR